MQFFLPFTLLLLSLVLIESAKVDRLEKKAKDRKGRSNIKKMLSDLEAGGRGDRKDDKGNGLRLKTVNTDANGNKLRRIQQEYDGLKVYGYEVIERETPERFVTVEDKGKNKKVRKPKEKKHRGKIISGLEGDLGKIDKTKLNPGMALKKLKERKNAKKVFDEQAEPMIYIDKDTGKAGIAYEVSYVDEEHLSIPTAIYDENAKLIGEWDNLQGQSTVKQVGTGPGGNDKTGKYTYGVDEDPLFVKELGNGRCQFDSDKVRVMNLNGSTKYHSFNTIFEYDCYEHKGDDSINGGYSALNDVNHFAHRIFDMYEEWYPNSSVITNLQPMTFKVHLGKNYSNAHYSPKNNYALFGDGKSTHYHPFSTLDIISHEVAHGVTASTSGLRYVNQSGGLNEAFSDMASKAAERFVRGFDRVQWGFGFDATKSATGRIRCIDNPPCNGKAIDNIDQYIPDMNVHHSSGVFNKVFYLLSNSFKYDLSDAFDLFYIANTNFWQQETTFLEAAEYTLEAMEEMKQRLHNKYSYKWINMDTIVDAFNQVGIQCTRNDGDQENDPYWDCV